jgi:hypothetical protein
MMSDRPAGRRTGNRVPAAHFVPGKRPYRGTLGRAGWLLVAGVVSRIRRDSETREHGGQYDTSHRNLLDDIDCNAIPQTMFRRAGITVGRCCRFAEQSVTVCHAVTGEWSAMNVAFARDHLSPADQSPAVRCGRPQMLSSQS